MKKFVTFLTISLICFTSLFASDGVIYLGYCDGLINSLGTGKSGECTVEAAIRIPKNKLKIFVGCEIKQIRVGLAMWNGNMRPDTITAWVRTSLDGENIVEGSISELVQDGWNEIELEESFNITGEEAIYMGISYYQKSKCNILSLIGTSVNGGAYIAKNGEWVDYSEMDYGNLSLEGVVTGDNLPKYDLNLSLCQPAHMSVKYGESIEIMGTIENEGANSVKGYNINYTINNDIEGTILRDTTLQYREVDNFVIYIPTNGLEINEGDVSVDINITFAEEVQDQYPENNSTMFNVVLYTTAFERKVLFEQFTSEYCVACPSGGERIAEALAQGYTDQCVRIAHHAGYGTDWLTIDESEDYTWFYGDPMNLLAPAYALNRHYNANNTKSGYIIQNVGEPNEIAESIAFELLDPAFVTINIDTDVIDNVLHITVSGERHEVFGLLCETPRLTIMIKENQIEAISQYGAFDGYIHDNVLRRVVTDTWGDVVAWDNNTYTVQYTTPIADEWVMENVQVVAFIHAYDPKDLFNCVVFNAEQTSADTFAGVGNISAQDEIVKTTYYTLQGVQLPAEPEDNGIYIRQELLQSGNTITNKTLINR